MSSMHSDSQALCWQLVIHSHSGRWIFPRAIRCGSSSRPLIRTRRPMREDLSRSTMRLPRLRHSSLRLDLSHWMVSYSDLSTGSMSHRLSRSTVSPRWALSMWISSLMCVMRQVRSSDKNETLQQESISRSLDSSSIETKSMQSRRQHSQVERLHVSILLQRPRSTSSNDSSKNSSIGLPAILSKKISMTKKSHLEMTMHSSVEMLYRSPVRPMR